MFRTKVAETIKNTYIFGIVVPKIATFVR